MSEFAEKIAAHREAGTCWLCNKPVGAGEGIHGLTGGHWDCHARIKAVTEEAKPQPQAPRVLKLARANGGNLIHIVDLRTMTALCGHKPKDEAHRMRKRGKWLQTAKTHPTCDKCIAQREKDANQGEQHET